MRLRELLPARKKSILQPAALLELMRPLGSDTLHLDASAALEEHLA